MNLGKIKGVNKLDEIRHCETITFPLIFLFENKCLEIKERECCKNDT